MINKLQDILTPVGSDMPQISLPQVAVVGSQSSGKSSVLETLVGRDLLLRGQDICSCRPLVLMLENRGPKPGNEHRASSATGAENTCTTSPQSAAKFREAGLNKGFRISKSPNVLNMTLVDLHGILGDQPRDTEAMTRKMIMDYIIQQNCIILAVSRANSDLATSDAIQMAREADTTGFLTIGAIAKLYIMDGGTDAWDFLLGKIIPLQLGYVSVVNRSREDINKNCGIAAALAYEEKFFNGHPVLLAFFVYYIEKIMIIVCH